MNILKLFALLNSLIIFAIRFEIVSNMIIINVKENESIDKALKRFKKKFERTGVLKEIRNRSYYEKPSVTNRTVRIKAAYRQKMQTKENQ